MISVSSTLRLAALVATLLLPAQAAAAAAVDDVPDEPVGIDIVGVQGYGCPPGTVAVSTLPDNGGFRLHFTGFRAEAGGSAPAGVERPPCLVELKVHAPDGFAYAVSRYEYRGTQHAEPDGSTRMRPSFYFTGLAPLILYQHLFAGPVDGVWQATRDFPPAAQMFSYCEDSRHLHITSELRAYPSSTSDQSTWMSLSGADAYALYAFAWQRC